MGTLFVREPAARSLSRARGRRIADDRVYAESAFRRHLLGGIFWAAGLVKGGCRV
jgi:hypothetical protein